MQNLQPVTQGYVNQLPLQQNLNVQSQFLTQSPTNMQGFVTPAKGTQSYMTQSPIPQNYIGQPGLAQSYVEQPGMTQAYLGQPGLAQSYVEQPGFAQTYVGQPGLAQSYVVQPGMTQTYATQPELVQTYVGEPEVVNQSNIVVEQPKTKIQECVYRANPAILAFGKIKGIQIVSFKNAELERTLNRKSSFATVGILNVLYFPDLDRFVLSLNGWKYALLRRLPIVGSEPNLTGPITYTLPTVNGFYTLTIPQILQIEALRNFETILKENSRFTVSKEDSVFRQQLLAGQITNPALSTTGLVGVGTTEFVDPNQALAGQALNQSEYMTPEQTIYELEGAHPGPLGKGQRFKRGMLKFMNKLTTGGVQPNALNLNMYHVRDIYSIKRTTETMALTEAYPRKEVERWVVYNKQVATMFGFEPESYAEPGVPLGLNSSPTASAISGRMRGYGSVDLGQGSLSNPVCLERITSERPSYTAITGNLATVGPSGRKNYSGYTSKSFRAGHHHRYPAEAHQSLSGPTEMTINQGTVLSTTSVTNQAIIQDQPIIQESAVIQEPTVVTRLEERFVEEQPLTTGTFAEAPMFQLTQPVEIITEKDLTHLQRNYPGFVDMYSATVSGPITPIVGQETYIQERPVLAQQIETGIMSESLGAQNTSATFGNQFIAPENVVVGSYTQEATINPVQTSPSLLQRVENRIANLENPSVEYVQPTVMANNYIGPQVISGPQIIGGQRTVINPQQTAMTRDMQHLSLMDKVKGYFRGRKPADEGGIPPEQLAKVRGDGTLHHYQA